MTDDPIVEEVHRTRAKLLAKCDGDLDRYMDRLQKLESDESGLLVKSVEDLKVKTKTPV
ncbi:MAG TPA: hypothetical protein VGG06_09750 [Thermoanaerobaculia bacterium]|jgi:hypothetical protein